MLALKFGFDRPKAVVVIDIENMNRISLGQRLMTVDDHQIFVIAVGGLESEIMAAEHDRAAVGERIDHQELVVNDGADCTLGRQLLGAKIAKHFPIINARGANDRDIALEKGMR